MKLQNLQVTNFSNIKSLTVDFATTPLVNLITGDNGSGKSSILKAVAYALLRSTEGNTEDYIRWGQTSFSVRLGFTHAGISYLMKVEYSKKGKTGTSVRELSFKSLTGEPQLLTGSDALNYMETILGSSSASYSIFAAQGDLDFIYATPAVRRQLLQNLYDVSFKDEVSLVTEQLEDAKRRVVVSQENVSRNEGILEGLSLMEVPKLPCSEEVYAVLRVQAEKQAEKRLELHAIMAEYQKLLEKKTAASLEVQKAEKELTHFNEKHIGSLSEDRLREVAQSVVAEQQKAIQEAQSLRAVLPRPRKEPVEESAEKEALTGAWLAATTKKTGIEYLYNALTSDTGKCPTCGTVLKEVDHEKIRATKEDLDRVIEEVRVIEARMNELKSILDDYNNYQAGLVKLIEFNSQLDTTISKHETTIRTVQERLQQNIAALSTVVAQRKDLEANLIRQQEDYQKIVAEMENVKLEDVMTAIERLTEEQFVINAQIESYDKAKIEADAAKAHNASIEKKRADTENLLRVVKEELTELQRSVEEWTAVRSILQTTLPSYVLTNLTLSLEAAANLFMKTAYHGRYEIKIQENERAGIELLYGTDGVWKPASGASGAERSLINLGIKVGLSRLSGLSLLILDEVDAYLSTANAKALFEILRNQLQMNMLEQIFVITHDESVKETLGANGVVYEMVNGELAKES